MYLLFFAGIVLKSCNSNPQTAPDLYDVAQAAFAPKLLGFWKLESCFIINNALFLVKNVVLFFQFSPT
jgi:hypothetical protein